MSVNNIARTARLYLRAEFLAARIRLRSETQRILLLGLAGALAVLGLVLVNVAFYAALVSVWGPVWTPLALGGADLALAIIAIVAAALQRPGPELQVAEDMKALAAAELEEQLQGGFTMQGLMSGLGGAGASNARLIIPLVTSLISILKKRKEAKE